MSRGGRRRRSKRGNRPPGAPAPQGSRAQPESQVDEEPEKQPAGRVRKEQGGRQRSALESMRTLPTSVQTLPPDGLILEELISNMQTEYGTPTTPQEYRLIVKLSPHEETPAPQVPEANPEVAEGEDEPAARPSRSSRRRRRGRRRSGAVAEDDSAEAPDQLEPDDEDDLSGDGSDGEGEVGQES